MFSKKLLITLILVITYIFSFGFFNSTLAVSQNNSCPILKSGDMIKVVGKPAIYILDDNLHYQYFPDGDVFKSWNSDDSYSKYYTNISQKCFDSLQAVPSTPFHAFYRAGSYLVKYLSSDSLFVVGLDNKLYPIVTTAAKAIFGNSYVYKNIGPSEWPSYTKESATITKAEIYPGMLLKINNKNYFVDEEKVLHEVTAAGMTANRFRNSFVRNLPASVLEDNKIGEMINSQISGLVTRNERNTGEYLSTEFVYRSVSVKTVKPQPMKFFTHIMSVSGEVKNLENQKIIEQGIVWDYVTSLQIDTPVIPTIEKNAQKVVAELEQNNFSVDIFGLPPSAYPFIRAYAIVEDNTVVYGKVEPINQTLSGVITYGTPALPIVSGGGIKTYTLTYLAGANGTLTGTTVQTIEQNKNGTAVTVNPNLGYHFVDWSDGKTDNPRTDINIISDITVTANFAANSYNLIFQDYDGTPVQTSTYDFNADLTGHIPPADPVRIGYTFTGWSPAIPVNMPANNVSTTAQYTTNTYTLTYTAGANGSITGSSSQIVNYGSDGSTVTATPNTGYDFVQWSDGVSTSYRTDLNVSNDITVEAQFVTSSGLTNYLYVARDNTIIKIDVSDSGNGATVAQSPSYGGTIYVLVTHGDYVYAGGYATNRIRRYKLSDLSFVDESPSYGGAIWSIIIHGDYVYTGGMYTRTIRKYNLNDLTYTGVQSPLYTTSGPSDFAGIRAMVINGDYIYAGGSYTRTVRKYNLSDLTYTGFESPNYGYPILALAVKDSYIYIGGGYAGDGASGASFFEIKKNNLSDLSFTGIKSAGFGGSSGYIQSLKIDGDYIFCGGRLINIKKYNSDDLSYLQQTAGITAFYINDMLIDGDYIYGGGPSSDYKIRKFKKSDMSLVWTSPGYGARLYSIVK